MDKTVRHVVSADDPCATNRKYGASKNIDWRRTNVWGKQCAYSTSWTESRRSSDGSPLRDQYSIYRRWKLLQSGCKTLWKAGTNPPDRDSRNTANAVQIDVVSYESSDSQTRKRSRKRSTDKTMWPARFMKSTKRCAGWAAAWAAVAGCESGSARRTPQTGHTGIVTIKWCGCHKIQKGLEKREKMAWKNGNSHRKRERVRIRNTRVLCGTKLEDAMWNAD